MATIKLVQNDTRPPLEFTITQDGSAVDLTGCTVVFYMQNVSTGDVKVDGGACTITDAENGKCQYAWQADDLDTVGTYSGEVQVTFPDSKVQTSYATFKLIVRDDITAS